MFASAAQEGERVIKWPDRKARSIKVGRPLQKTNFSWPIAIELPLQLELSDEIETTIPNLYPYFYTLFYFVSVNMTFSSVCCAYSIVTLSKEPYKIHVSAGICPEMRVDTA